MLFAFLLTVPFSARFGRATSFQQDIYFVSLLLAALATVMLITDVLYGGVATIVVGICTAAMFLGGWYVMPLWRRSRRERELSALASESPPESAPREP